MTAEANTARPDSFWGAAAGRGIGVRRVLKVQHRNLGGLPPRKRGQESDGTVVAAKRGNARGAKGSCIKGVSNRKARSDLSEEQRLYTIEEATRAAARQKLPQHPHLASLREKLSAKARREPNFKFFNLYGHVLQPETLECAYRMVRANDGAAGVDGVTFEDIENSEGGVGAFVAGIAEELHAKTYKASPVRRCFIDKANGRKRALGIPTIKDRVVQCAVRLVIEPIFEEDFHECSYGFRPNRGAKDAVEKVAGEIKSGKPLVYDADLSSYFDTIPHEKLVACLRMRVVDNSVIALVRQWLKVCAREPSGVLVKPRGKGTPQGGVISPLLSNIYLHWFETRAAQTASECGQVMSIVRYADDFVILAQKWEEGFVEKVEGILENWMELKVNREKTRLVDLRERHAVVVFLGYEFRYVRDTRFGSGRRYLHFGPAMKSVKKVCRTVHEHTHARNCKVAVKTVIERLNKVLSGWARYFSVGYASRAFGKVNHYVLRRMARWLNRRSQRYYRLRYSTTYYGELQHLGLLRLRWADYRPARK